MFLKWEDELLGVIDPDSYEVKIINPHLNPTVERLFHGKSVLSAEEWHAFLADRIVSRDRRDIEKVLYTCGLSRYDVFKIAEFTRAFNVKDKCWIAFDLGETYEDCMKRSLEDVLLKNRDIEGGTAHSPGGQQVKRYGFFGDKFGIYKERLNPVLTDVESEVAVYLLSKKMGIPCCPATQVDSKTVFSEYLYDFNHESFVHFRNLFPIDERINFTVDDLLRVRPQYQTELFQMLALDFITHQDDRHPSNYAIKISGDKETFYPLYDNGRSLFFEDTEDIVKMKCTNPIVCCNSFGRIGSQWDALTDLLTLNPSLGKTVNLDISDKEISDVLQEANITGYRCEGAKVWIRKSIDSLKELILRLEAQKEQKDETKAGENPSHNQKDNKSPLDDQIEAASARACASRPLAKNKTKDLEI